MPCRHQFESEPEFITALRDYFAAKAMAAFIATADDPHTEVAMDAYKLADAMLTERQKGTK